MVLLWGVIEDGPLWAVYRCLQERGIKVAFIDQRSLRDYRFESNLSASLFTGKISWSGGSVNLADVTAIYLRPYDFTQLPAFKDLDSSEQWASAARFEEGMLLWSELSDGIIVNRPSAMASNSSKPYQSELIKKCGFLVPDTIVTTDPDRVMRFWEANGDVIYKSVSNRRSMVRRLHVDDIARIQAVTSCPTQFQQFISGRDFRVHVLDKLTFACSIRSEADDYRYSSDTLMIAIDLPPELKSRCLALTRKLGLHFSGIDLRETSNGEWFCFEVNPSPGYTSFISTAGELTNALADFLTTKCRTC
jgi:hypothetical protein